MVRTSSAPVVKDLKAALEEAVADTLNLVHLDLSRRENPDGSPAGVFAFVLSGGKDEPPPTLDVGTYGLACTASALVGVRQHVPLFNVGVLEVSEPGAKDRRYLPYVRDVAAKATWVYDPTIRSVRTVESLMVVVWRQRSQGSPSWAAVGPGGVK